MVFLHKLLFAVEKKLSRQILRSGQFIDTLRLNVKGGHGGNGLTKYGGVGGQGGCVYMVAKEGLSLREVLKKNPTKRIHAGNGEDSSKTRILGFRGEDRLIEVPVGVTVIDDKGKVIGDLNNDGNQCLAAGGGGGGCSGNMFIGKPGEQRSVNLDLKLIADVGLVGFPNAGKSTFLKAISQAKPKIASYPFTTIRPQIGTVEYDDYRQITIADLPGLIEGAHLNYGMGIKFLKHIERTRLIIILIDINDFQLNDKYKNRNCLEVLYSINKEIELYNETLLNKSCLLLINKMDLDNSLSKFNYYKKYFYNLSDGLRMCPDELKPKQLFNFHNIIPISANNLNDVNGIKNVIRNILDDNAEKELISNDTDIRMKLCESGPKVY